MSRSPQHTRALLPANQHPTNGFSSLTKLDEATPTVAEPIKHHFSPVFYLRGWCDSTTGKLIEYSRPYKDVIARPVHPAATGYARSLYTMEGLPEDQKQTIEKDYMAAKVDDPASKALRVLLGTNTNALTEQLRAAWTRFLLATLHRRPKAVAEIGDSFKAVLRQNLLADTSYEVEKQPGDPPTRFEWVEKHHPHLIGDAAKEMVVRATENQNIGNIIINMQWSTLDMSASRHELLTGDMPHLRFNGLKDPKCAILFPLSPTKLFIATHDRTMEHAINRRKKTDVVKLVNDNIVRIAERYVYARTDGHLWFVEKRLRPSDSPVFGSVATVGAASSLP
jgi:uncharacterized protein DUF4238